MWFKIKAYTGHIFIERQEFSLEELALGLPGLFLDLSDTTGRLVSAGKGFLRGIL